jgi:hypothetical protein
MTRGDALALRSPEHSRRANRGRRRRPVPRASLGQPGRVGGLIPQGLGLCNRTQSHARKKFFVAKCLIFKCFTACFSNEIKINRKNQTDHRRACDAAGVPAIVITVPSRRVDRRALARSARLRPRGSAAPPGRSRLISPPGQPISSSFGPVNLEVDASWTPLDTLRVGLCP